MNASELREKIRTLLPHFKYAVVLDSCTDLSTQNHVDLYGKYDLIAGFANECFNIEKKSDFEQLNNPKKLCMGFIQYDAKIFFEKIENNNPAFINLPLSSFIFPELILKLKGNKLEIEGNFPQYLDSGDTISKQSVLLVSKIEKQKYVDNVNSILREIQLGNIYEMNYCTSFSLETENFDPFATYLKLISQNPVPFSGFVKYNQSYLICNSPERYMAKIGNKLISQPIKGTSKRGKTESTDYASALRLKNSPKEWSENVMIVDLVRNDLSRVAKTATVKVEELAHLYSFPFVHQLISTISCNTDKSFSEILAATFPMGSMTGAPKVSAMNIIERFEDFSRGWYSGSIGYIEDSGDFDFNVVIRSVMYDQKTNKLFYAAGGAITSLSNPEEEWEELKLKVAHIEKLLNVQN